jgi:AGCS family alanine or glycine:cation symporter
MAYRIIWVVAVVVGAVGGLTFMWDLADTLNALMAFPNLIGVLMLSPVVFRLTKEFFAAEKSKANE